MGWICGGKLAPCQGLRDGIRKGALLPAAARGPQSCGLPFRRLRKSLLSACSARTLPSCGFQLMQGRGLLVAL